MAITSRKPSVRDGPNRKGGRKIRRSHRNAAKWSGSKSPRPVAAKRQPNRPGSSYRPPFHYTSVAITDLDIPLDSRRLVLIDGENVSYNDISGLYLSSRIYQAYQWFTANGHRALVLIPEYLTRKLIGDTPDMRIECISGIADGEYNHSRNEPFERILLQRARDEEAAILSERAFNLSFETDLDIVQNRVIGFTFFKESIFIPVDPYGRAGPWLRVILRK